MRETAGRNAPEAAKIAAFAKENGVDLRTVELEVLSQHSVDAAVSKEIGESGRIDVLIHNAGHMVFGRPKPSPPSSWRSSTTSMF